MARPPKIVVPGLSRGKGIPPGYILGRVDGGRGPVQLLRQQQLGRLGVAPKAGTAVRTHQAGFSWSINGLPSAGHLVGSGTWSRDLVFHNGDPNSVNTAGIAATSTAHLHMTDAALNVLGSITFNAGFLVGGVVWNTDPFTWPAGQLMHLYAPSPADATLANMAGRVVGYFV